MSRRATIIGCALASAAAPSLAHAHLVNSGLGPVYDGALHLLMSLDDLLGLLAIAMLAGLCGARASRLAVLSLPGAWLLTGLIGLRLPLAFELPWLSALSFVVLGALVALDLKLPAPLVAILAALFGALHGLLNGSALAAVGAGPSSVFGIAAAALIIALLVSALVTPLREAWQRIVVRVAGSWVTAVGILMLGWWVRGA
jgi:hydrogenase/urease accessory protein HupE